jgi:thioredoxin reductase
VSCSRPAVVQPTFDVIVVGGGPAGLSAALMLGRCRRRVVVCDDGHPRNARSRSLHGYLTRDGIAPSRFNALGRRELAPYGVELRKVRVNGVERNKTGFRVSLQDGKRIAARFLLLATGVVDELPPLSGMADCYGRSVFHCPYCDGWEWKDRRLAVLGEGVSGVKLALSLKTWSADLVLCTNGRGLAANDRARLGRNAIEIRTEPIAALRHARGRLRSLAFENGPAVDRDALFFSTGQHSRSDLALRLGCAFTSRGTVNTGLLCNTNIPGVFVVGDASRDAQFVVVAAAEGAKAALAINQALQREELVS